jgi:hypothetical protein
LRKIEAEAVPKVFQTISNRTKFLRLSNEDMMTASMVEPCLRSDMPGKPVRNAMEAKPNTTSRGQFVSNTRVGGHRKRASSDVGSGMSS